MNPGAVPVLFGAICVGAAVRAAWRWDTNDHGDGLHHAVQAVAHMHSLARTT